MIQQDLHHTEVSSLLSSFPLLIFHLLAYLLWSVLVPVTRQWAAELKRAEEIARNALLVHSRFDIISIRTSGTNQGAELKQGKLRCLKGFHNEERKLALQQYEIRNKNAEREGAHKCKHTLLMTRRSLANPHLMLHLSVCFPRSLSPSLSCTHTKLQ